MACLCIRQTEVEPARTGLASAGHVVKKAQKGGSLRGDLAYIYIYIYVCVRICIQIDRWREMCAGVIICYLYTEKVYINNLYIYMYTHVHISIYIYI